MDIFVTSSHLDGVTQMVDELEKVIVDCRVASDAAWMRMTQNEPVMDIMDDRLESVTSHTCSVLHRSSRFRCSTELEIMQSAQ
eukprot:5467140-Amphidinium_carterae.1